MNLFVSAPEAGVRFVVRAKRYARVTDLREEVAKVFLETFQHHPLFKSLSPRSMYLRTADGAHLPPGYMVSKVLEPGSELVVITAENIMTDSPLALSASGQILPFTGNDASAKSAGSARLGFSASHPEPRELPLTPPQQRVRSRPPPKAPACARAPAAKIPPFQPPEPPAPPRTEAAPSDSTEEEPSPSPPPPSEHSPTPEPPQHTPEPDPAPGWESSDRSLTEKLVQPASDVRSGRSGMSSPRTTLKSPPIVFSAPPSPSAIKPTVKPARFLSVSFSESETLSGTEEDEPLAPAPAPASAPTPAPEPVPAPVLSTTPAAAPTPARATSSASDAVETAASSAASEPSESEELSSEGSPSSPTSSSSLSSESSDAASSSNPLAALAEDESKGEP